MKKPMSQILLVALSIVFSCALALTVAMLCISLVRKVPETFSELYSTSVKDPNDPLQTETLPILLPSQPPSDIESGSDSAPFSEPTEEPTPIAGTLAFSSNGNGTCTLLGLGSCTDLCITVPEYSPAGDRVTAIAPRAFYNCLSLTAIQIPATVTNIGELAFGACDNLMYISVSDANLYYCDIDGILYTADLFSLLFYPPMRAGSSVSIPSMTAEIADMAFLNCAYLTHVDYEGSAEEWEQIDIGIKNYSLTAASKSFLQK